MTKEYKNLVVQTISGIVVPFIQLFALYVITHGHSSPGGGFQGGVILAASFILLSISQGLTFVRKALSPQLLIVLASSGVLVFSGIGLLALFWGGNYLDYGAFPLPLSPNQLRALMIFLVEAGIGTSVFAVMVLIALSLIAEEDYDRPGTQ